MHPNVDIRSVLRRFAQQRQRLLWRRAALTFFSVLGFGALAGACLDHWVPGIDGFRVPIAVFIYVAALFGAWKRAGRALCSPPDDGALARMIEYSTPSLGGRLLSTVELSDAAKETRAAASGFIPLLQKDVSQRVKILPRDILSSQHFLRRETWLLVAVVLPALALLFTPSGRLHLVRTLVPLNEIERPSLTKIHILQPSPREGFVPEHEQIPVEVAIHNPGKTAPVLEMLSAKHPTRSVSMSSSEPGRFLSALTVQTEPVRYRITSGDAFTRTLNLHPVARPKVTAHTLQLRFPSYTGKTDLSQTDAAPRIHALVGTTAVLSFQTSEAIREGSLRFISPAGGADVPLQKNANDPLKMSAQFLIQENCAFYVHLISARTGLHSLTYPIFQVHADPDSAPSIQIVTPTEETVLQADQKLTAEFSVTDDFPGVVISAWLRRGNEAWTEKQFEKTSATAVHLRETIEALAAAGAPATTPREDVFFKISAVDSAGQKTESRTIRIRCDAGKTEMNPLEGFGPRKALSQFLEDLTQSLQNTASSLADAAGAGINPKPETLAQAAVNGATSVQNASRAIEQIQQHLYESIRNSEADREDAYLASRALNRLRFEKLAPLESGLEKLSHPTDTLANTQLSRQIETSAAAANDARDLSAKTDALLKAGLAAQLADALPRTPGAAHPANPTDTAPNPAAPLEDLRASERFEESVNLLMHASKTAQSVLKDSMQQIRDSQKAPEERERVRTAVREQIAALHDALGAEHDDARNALRKGLPTAAELADRASFEAAKNTQDAESRERVAQTAETLRADARTEAARPDAAPSMEQALTQAARALRGLAQSEESSRDVAQTAARVSAELRPLEAFAQLEETAASASRISRNQALSGDPAVLTSGDVPQPLQNQIQEVTPRLRAANFPEAAVAAAEASQNSKTPGEAAKLLQEALGQSRDLARKHQSALAGMAPSLATELASLAQKAQRGAQKTEGFLAAPPAPETLQAAAKGERQLAQQIEAARETLRTEANAQNTLSAEGRERARDADAADALLRPAAQAAEALNKAAQRPTQQPALSKPLLENAARLQKQNADQLADLAEHFANLQSGSTDKAKTSREKLRAKEKEAGIQSALEDRTKESEKLESLSAQAESKKTASTTNPESANGGGPSTQAPQTPGPPAESQNADSTSQGSPQEGKSSSNNASNTASRDGQSAAAQAAASARERAENALKSDSPTASQAVAAAVEARKQADRLSRSEQSLGTSGADSAAPSETTADAAALPALPSAPQTQNADWAKLPKRVADDLKRGKNEGIRGEYQQAVEAYFRAVAEKARR